MDVPRCSVKQVWFLLRRVNYSSEPAYFAQTWEPENKTSCEKQRKCVTASTIRNELGRKRVVAMR